MKPTTPPETAPPADAEEPGAPVCVMSFNASDASGGAGVSADIATISAMGGHPLPVITSIVLRDTAEIFEQAPLEDDTVVEQARIVLEDITLGAWKVGFLGSADIVSAVAEVLSDYPDVPLVTHVSSLTWLDDEDAVTAYHEALRQLVLPLTQVLVGNQQVLTDFLLPDWDSERPPSARELAVAAEKHGAGYVLVTGIQLPNNFVDNVLASPQGAITGEKFERFEAGFVGAGDTLSAALASLLAAGQELHLAVSEALAFLDESLDAGFRPGMGSVVPDRFFWAVPPEEEGEGGAEGEPNGSMMSDDTPPPPHRKMH